MKKIFVILSILTSTIGNNYYADITHQTPQAITEFSLLLKPSPRGNIGLFAMHDIPAGTPVIIDNFKRRILKIKDVPAEFRHCCVYLSKEELECPEHFDRIESLWYVNHSQTPNLARVDQKVAVALKDIKAGQELFINFNQPDEPEKQNEKVAN